MSKDDRPWPPKDYRHTNAYRAGYEDAKRDLSLAPMTDTPLAKGEYPTPTDVDALIRWHHGRARFGRLGVGSIEVAQKHEETAQLLAAARSETGFANLQPTGTSEEATDADLLEQALYVSRGGTWDENDLPLLRAIYRMGRGSPAVPPAGAGRD